MFDSIIFDLDGTLWDSREEICAAWNKSLQQLFPQPPIEITVELLTACMGMLLPDIGRKLLPQMEEETLRTVMTHCCQVENDYLAQVGAALYPQLEETLTALGKTYPLFIVSNCQAGYIECFFTAHGLQHHFTDWACPGDTGLPKADNIRLVVERNGLKCPLYVGDTQGDCNAATAAGVPFLHAAYGFGQVAGDYPSVETFTEIPEKLLSIPPFATT